MQPWQRPPGRACPAGLFLHRFLPVARAASASSTVPTHLEGPALRGWRAQAVPSLGSGPAGMHAACMSRSPQVTPPSKAFQAVPADGQALGAPITHNPTGHTCSAEPQAWPSSLRTPSLKAQPGPTAPSGCTTPMLAYMYLARVAHVGGMQALPTGAAVLGGPAWQHPDRGALAEPQRSRLYWGCSWPCKQAPSSRPLQLDGMCAVTRSPDPSSCASTARISQPHPPQLCLSGTGQRAGHGQGLLGKVRCFCCSHRG